MEIKKRRKVEWLIRIPLLLHSICGGWWKQPELGDGKFEELEQLEIWKIHSTERLGL